MQILHTQQTHYHPKVQHQKHQNQMGFFACCQAIQKIHFFSFVLNSSCFFLGLKLHFTNSCLLFFIVLSILAHNVVLQKWKSKCLTNRSNLVPCLFSSLYSKNSPYKLPVPIFTLLFKFLYTSSFLMSFLSCFLPDR